MHEAEKGKVMFKQFYKDAETLHVLVKPFIRHYHMDRMNDSLVNFAQALGRLAIETIATSMRTEWFIENLDEYNEA